MTARRVLLGVGVGPMLTAVFFFTASNLQAQEARVREPAPSRWAVAAGPFGVADEDSTLEIGLEHRLRPFRLGPVTLTPALGATVTEKESVWLYGGVRWDLPLSEHWIATPNFAVAFYDDGNGKDLGGFVEFRSGIEIAYRFVGGQRFGLALYHLSNGGLYERNPGSESLVLAWSF